MATAINGYYIHQTTLECCPHLPSLLIDWMEIADSCRETLHKTYTADSLPLQSLTDCVNVCCQIKAYCGDSKTYQSLTTLICTPPHEPENILGILIVDQKLPTPEYPNMHILSLVTNPKDLTSKLIHGERQNPGVGGALLRRAEEIANKHLKGIRLSAYESATSFYEKQGYTCIDTALLRYVKPFQQTSFNVAC